MSDRDQTGGVASTTPAAEVPAENVSVHLLNKLRVSRIRRISDPGASCSTSAGAADQPSSSQHDSSDDEALSARLWRIHVASRPSPSTTSCTCGGRRCFRSPGGCRRRPLLLRPARLKPARRPLLKEARLLRREGTRKVFGTAAPERCSEFSQVKRDEVVRKADGKVRFADAGAPVFSGTAALQSPSSTAGAGSTDGSASPPSCSLQHRQRRPASVDELAGLVSQVAIMSSMAEMMYT